MGKLLVQACQSRVNACPRRLLCMKLHLYQTKKVDQSPCWIAFVCLDGRGCGCGKLWLRGKHRHGWLFGLGVRQWGGWRLNQRRSWRRSHRGAGAQARNRGAIFLVHALH